MDGGIWGGIIIKMVNSLLFLIYVVVFSGIYPNMHTVERIDW